MAYVRSPQTIIDSARGKNLRFWTVIDCGTKKKQDEQNDEEMSLEESLMRLEDCLDGLDGTVEVILREKSTATRPGGGNIPGNFVYTIKVGEAARRSNGVSGMGGDMISLLRELHQKDLELLKLKMDFDQQLKDLKKELSESSSGDTATKLLEQFAPHLISHFMNPKQSAPFSQPAGIAGIDNNQQLISPEQVEKMNQDIKRILKVDPDFCTHLSMIADFATTKPDKYKAVIPFLNNL